MTQATRDAVSDAETLRLVVDGLIYEAEVTGYDSLDEYQALGAVRTADNRVRNSVGAHGRWADPAWVFAVYRDAARMALRAVPELRG